MQQAHETAGVADSLPEPDDGFAGPLAVVCGQGRVLGHALGLVDGRDGKDEQQGQGGPRDKGQQLGLRDGVDVVDLERAAEAQAVQQRRHELRVGFEGDEGRRGARGRVGVGLCC